MKVLDRWRSTSRALQRYSAGSGAPPGNRFRTRSKTSKAVIRKRGWPTTSKTFRTKRDDVGWARRVGDDMVRGVYIEREASERLTFGLVLDRYLAEVTPTKKPTMRGNCWRGQQRSEDSGCLPGP